MEESGKNRMVFAWQQAAMHRWAKTKTFPRESDKLIGEHRIKKDSPEKMRSILREFVSLREKTNAQPKTPETPKPKTKSKK